jgi:hypothetical protein
MSLAPVSGNFNKVAKSLMDKLPHMNDKRTFILQQYAFNVLVKDQFVFLAIVSLPPHTTPDTTRLVIARGDSPTRSNTRHNDIAICATLQPRDSLRLRFHLIVCGQVENALKCPKTMPFSFLESVAKCLFELRTTGDDRSDTVLGLS